MAFVIRVYSIFNFNKLVGNLLLFILLVLIHFKLYSQCASPYYQVQGDSIHSTGNIILSATGCPSCSYQWFDSSANPISSDDTLIQPNSGNTLYYLLVTDDLTGCTNMDPFSGYPDSIYSFDYFHTTIAPPGNPNNYGDGIWNVYCYNNCYDQNCTNYVGYYSDNTDFNGSGKLIVRSWQLWSQGSTSTPPEYVAVEASPFSMNQTISGNPYTFKVSTYQGNLVDPDHHMISYKRKNFPAGYYQFDIDIHWNACWVYINGVQVFTHQGYNHGHENIWWGYLDGNSTVEYRWINDVGASKGYFTLTKLSGVPSLSAPDVIIGQSTCQYKNPLGLGAVFPINDTYVSSNSADTNYGSNVSDTLINCTSIGENSIFMFDLSNLSDPNINRSILYFTGSMNCPTCFTYIPTAIRVYALSDTSWNEQMVTWNNLTANPSVDTLIGGVTVYQTFKTRYQFDITTYVRSLYQQGFRKIAFYLRMYLSPPDNLYRTFQIISKEGSNVSDRPFLLINAAESNNFNSPSYQWEYDSTSNGLSWKSVPNATDLVYQPTELGNNTFYRVKVVDKFGHTKYSDTIHINLTTPNGELQLSTTEQGKELKLTNYTGTVKTWESSSDSIFSVIHPIVNYSDVLSNLSKTDLYYRVVLKDNTCSNIFKIFPDYKVYNTISPNNDGYNDTWQIDGIEHFPNNEVRIFNEWGQVVYNVNGYDNSEKVWKGTSSNSQRMLPDGTYFYCIDIKDQKSIKGYVILKR